LTLYLHQDIHALPIAKGADVVKNEFTYHEAVERLLVVQEIAQVILDHPAINEEPLVLDKLKEAVGALAEAYQIMAKILLELPEA
jgi:ubiquinone biosynthesis protein Coq4